MRSREAGSTRVIFHGVAERPTVIRIEAGRAHFDDAGDLWGRPVSQCVDALEARFGADIHTAVIGPAGENRVRFASIVSDRTYQAARMGMGAVMGAKRLKAVVISGDARPPVADPATCAAITERYRERMTENSLTRWQLEPPGFSAWVHLHGLDAALCTRNYRDATFEGTDAYAAANFMKILSPEKPLAPAVPTTASSCSAPATMQPSIHGRVASTRRSPARSVRIWASPIWRRSSGPTCSATSLGMDPTSLGFTLSMAMECAEHGLRAGN